MGIVLSDIKTPGFKAGEGGLSTENGGADAGDSRPKGREKISEFHITLSLPVF